MSVTKAVAEAIGGGEPYVDLEVDRHGSGDDEELRIYLDGYWVEETPADTDWDSSARVVKDV